MSADDPRPPLSSTGSVPSGTDDLATLRLNQSAMSRRAAQRLVAPALDPELVLAERFKIVRFIARGGMGEVYEALDLELNEAVALKTIRPDIAEDPMALARFKREIQLARKITHPNVSRMFDIFHHRWPVTTEGAEDRLTFLTMELLLGETLHERLAREGRMGPADAIVIVEQIAVALGAAHAAGIVHRDFKSANVILVPARTPGEPVRAVVTDFGLAFGGGGVGASMRTALTTAGDTLGTPDYMAPEQVTGGTITEAADIYALGVVLYEMVTGQRPFTSDSPLTTAIKRLNEPPPSPRLIVGDLDPLWEAVILRCLERQPADRYASAAEVVKALTGGTVTVSAREQLEHTRRQRRWLALAGGAVALLVLAAVGVRTIPALLRSREPVQPQTAVVTPAAKARRSVAVIGFKNLSGAQDTAWISTALSEMVTTELGAGEQVQMMSGERVARVKADLALSDAEAYPKSTLAMIRANLGTDTVVVGSYLVSGGKVRVNLRLQDTASGETIAAVGETGDEAQLIDLVSRTGAQLRDKLGLGALSAADAQSAQAALPANPEAARLFSEGLAKLRVFDALGAKGTLERAVIADPNHALAHSALAAAWSTMGYDTSARTEAKKAFDLAATLSREDRYVVEARYHEAALEWDQAAETYSKLFSFFPDNLEYGLRLAGAQTAAGKGRDALATLDALRKLPAPARDDPRLDLAESEAAKSLSDFKREQAAAAAAAAKGTKVGARLLVGNARLAEGWAFRNLGQLSEASGALEDAKSIFAAASDRGGLARAVNYQGLLLKDQGFVDQAREMFQQALTIRRATGDMAGVAATENNIATILVQRSQFAEARDMHAQALATYTQIGNRTGIAQTQQNMGNVSVNQGDLPTARKMYESALVSYRAIGNKGGEADMLNNIASLSLSQGDAAGARQMFEDALRIQRAIGRKKGVADGLTNLGLALAQSGDSAAAAKQFDEALVVYRELKDPDGVAGALTNSGIGLLQQGRLVDAKKAFSDALSANGSRSRTLTAQSRLGHVLMLQGDLAAARTTYEEALASWQQIGEKRAAGQTRVALARIAVEEGRAAEALAAAAAVADEFSAQKRADDEALALDVVARALLAQGKIPDAVKTVARAQALPAAAVSRETRFALSLTSARAAAATGKLADAEVTLSAALADATKAGIVAAQLDARLALGELEIQSGKRAAGQARLVALERDATAKSFGLMARQAAAARSASR